MVDQRARVTLDVVVNDGALDKFSKKLDELRAKAAGIGKAFENKNFNRGLTGATRKIGSTNRQMGLITKSTEKYVKTTDKATRANDKFGKTSVKSGRAVLGLGGAVRKLEKGFEGASKSARNTQRSIAQIGTSTGVRTATNQMSGYRRLTDATTRAVNNLNRAQSSSQTGTRGGAASRRNPVGQRNQARDADVPAPYRVGRGRTDDVGGRKGDGGLTAAARAHSAAAGALQAAAAALMAAAGSMGGAAARASAGARGAIAPVMVPQYRHKATGKVGLTRKSGSDSLTHGMAALENKIISALTSGNKAELAALRKEFPNTTRGGSVDSYLRQKLVARIVGVPDYKIKNDNQAMVALEKHRRRLNEEENKARKAKLRAEEAKAKLDKLRAGVDKTSGNLRKTTTMQGGLMPLADFVERRMKSKGFIDNGKVMAAPIKALDWVGSKVPQKMRQANNAMHAFRQSLTNSAYSAKQFARSMMPASLASKLGLNRIGDGPVASIAPDQLAKRIHARLMGKEQGNIDGTNPGQRRFHPRTHLAAINRVLGTSQRNITSAIKELERRRQAIAERRTGSMLAQTIARTGRRKVEGVETPQERAKRYQKLPHLMTNRHMQDVADKGRKYAAERDAVRAREGDALNRSMSALAAQGREHVKMLKADRRTKANIPHVAAQSFALERERKNEARRRATVFANHRPWSIILEHTKRRRAETAMDRVMRQDLANQARRDRHPVTRFRDRSEVLAHKKSRRADAAIDRFVAAGTKSVRGAMQSISDAIRKQIPIGPGLGSALTGDTIKGNIKRVADSIRGVQTDFGRKRLLDAKSKYHEAANAIGKTIGTPKFPAILKAIDRASDTDLNKIMRNYAEGMGNSQMAQRVKSGTLGQGGRAGLIGTLKELHAMKPLAAQAREIYQPRKVSYAIIDADKFNKQMNKAGESLQKQLRRTTTLGAELGGLIPMISKLGRAVKPATDGLRTFASRGIAGALAASERKYQASAAPGMFTRAIHSAVKGLQRFDQRLAQSERHAARHAARRMAFSDPMDKRRAEAARSRGAGPLEAEAMERGRTQQVIERAKQRDRYNKQNSPNSGMSPMMAGGLAGFMTRSRTGLGLRSMGAFSGIFSAGYLMVSGIKEFAKTELAEIRARAVTKGSDLDKRLLTSEIKALASKSQFSGADLFQASRFMGMAGLDAASQRQALPTVEKLAVATGMSLPAAADKITNIVSTVGGNIAQVTDQLMAVASNSNNSIDQLASAVKYGVGSGLGYGFDKGQMFTSLGLAGNVGMQGSMGGTGLRTFMSALIKMPKKLREALTKAGSKLYDKQGRLVTRDLGRIYNDLLRVKRRDADLLARALPQRAGTFANSQIGQLEKNPFAFAELELKRILSAGTLASQAKAAREGLTGDFNVMRSQLQGLAVAIGESGVGAALGGLAKSIGNAAGWITTKLQKASGTYLPKTGKEGDDRIKDLRRQIERDEKDLKNPSIVERMFGKSKNELRNRLKSAREEIARIQGIAPGLALSDAQSRISKLKEEEDILKNKGNVREAMEKRRERFREQAKLPLLRLGAKVQKGENVIDAANRQLEYVEKMIKMSGGLKTSDLKKEASELRRLIKNARETASIVGIDAATGRARMSRADIIGMKLAAIGGKVTRRGEDVRKEQEAMNKRFDRFGYTGGKVKVDSLLGDQTRSAQRIDEQIRLFQPMKDSQDKGNAHLATIAANTAAMAAKLGAKVGEVAGGKDIDDKKAARGASRVKPPHEWVRPAGSSPLSAFNKNAQVGRSDRHPDKPVPVTIKDTGNAARDRADEKNRVPNKIDRKASGTLFESLFKSWFGGSDPESKKPVPVKPVDGKGIWIPGFYGRPSGLPSLFGFSGPAEGSGRPGYNRSARDASFDAMNSAFSNARGAGAPVPVTIVGPHTVNPPSKSLLGTREQPLTAIQQHQRPAAASLAMADDEYLAGAKQAAQRVAQAGANLAAASETMAQALSGKAGAISAGGDAVAGALQSAASQIAAAGASVGARAGGTRGLAPRGASNVTRAAAASYT